MFAILYFDWINFPNALLANQYNGIFRQSTPAELLESRGILHDLSHRDAIAGYPAASLMMSNCHVATSTR